jgi:TldD protein
MKLLSVLVIFNLSLFGADDVVMRAMRDELERSMRKLQLENLQKPYFVAYRAVELQNCSISASFGALLTSYCEPAASGEARSRNLSVEVRVGDYTRDNTNFFVPMMFAGVARPLVEGLSVPIDDNYDELRRQFWLDTDSAYKTALDQFAKKKAALENRTRTDDAPDLSKEQVVTIVEAPPRVAWNREELEKMVKSLSAIFRESAGTDGSKVSLNATTWFTRYLNSEGTSYLRSSTNAVITVTADAQAADGMPVSDFEVARARSIDQLPPREEVVARIRALAARLDRLRTASLIEHYTGPVLFESNAAAELFLQALGSTLCGIPRLVMNDTRLVRVNNTNGGWADRIGARVLPDFLSVSDDPSAREFHGLPLLGGYTVDDEGVVPHPTVLIEKGILKTLIHTRALIPGTSASTGSKHRNGPMPSNLLITAEKPSTPAELRAHLLKMARDRGLEYGIVVRRMWNPQLQATQGRSRIIIMAGRGQTSIEVEPVIEAYKVFPDGHEELVRNLEINSLTLASFKDIVAASETTSVYTAPMRMLVRSPVNQVCFAVPGLPDLVSIAIPSLLFEDMSMKRPTGDVPNLPFTKHPFFDK